MKQQAAKKLWSILLAAALLIGMCVSLSKVDASAEEAFSIYTSTPGISLTAGDSASFDLYFSGLGESGADVSLEIASMPNGFTGYLKSGSYEVSKVHAKSNAEKAAATLSVVTDTSVAEGSYDIMVKGTTESGSEDTLTLTINISALKAGDSNFIVEYPDQEGVTGTSFSYSTTLVNNSLSSQNFNFSSDAPEGWRVTFSSNDTQVSSLEVEAGSSTGVTITVTPADDVAAGQYPISCSATSAKESLSTDLNVTILGTYDLDVSTIDGNLALDAYGNKTTDITVVVANKGNITLENIQLSAQANSEWTIEFDENIIESLAAGASQEIKAHITPSSDSITGDYITYITASCKNYSDTAELRVTVKTSTGWGIFAVIIIGGVLAGLYAVMRKYGRR